MTETQNVATYARIRPYNPAINEDKQLTARAVDDDKIMNQHNASEDTYNFTRVFDMRHDTDGVFQNAMRPLLDYKILQGINSIFIVYGQSGSGKSFTLIGEQGNLGILPMALRYLLDKSNVENIHVSTVEAYGIQAAKIGFYDLVEQLHHKQQVGKDFDAYANKDNPRLTSMNAQSIAITKDNCLSIITQLQAVSHMAPTLKNPHSSRGHTVYFCRVKMVDLEPVYFICVDLAGSEGQTALGTKQEFVEGLQMAMTKGKLHLSSKQMKGMEEMYKTRSMEAGCINNGLTQLQSIFGELIRKKISGAQGLGLRKVLSQFISLSSAYAIMFTLSASANNNKVTRATLNFAKQTQLVKVETTKAKKKIDKDKIIHELNEVIEQLRGEMTQKDKAIVELESRLAATNGLSGAGGDGMQRVVRSHTNQRSISDGDGVLDGVGILDGAGAAVDEQAMIGTMSPGAAAVAGLTSMDDMAMAQMSVATTSTDDGHGARDSNVSTISLNIGAAGFSRSRSRGQSTAFERYEQLTRELSEAEAEEQKWTVQESDLPQWMTPNMSVQDLHGDDNQLKHVFDKVDADGGGTIDGEELQTALREMGQELTLDGVNELIYEIDADGDGELNFEEFKELTQKSWFIDAYQQKLAQAMESAMARMHIPDGDEEEAKVAEDDADDMDEAQEKITHLRSETQQLQLENEELRKMLHVDAAGGGRRDSLPLMDADDDESDGGDGHANVMVTKQADSGTADHEYSELLQTVQGSADGLSKEMQGMQTQLMSMVQLQSKYMQMHEELSAANLSIAQKNQQMDEMYKDKERMLCKMMQEMDKLRAELKRIGQFQIRHSKQCSNQDDATKSWVQVIQNKLGPYVL